MSFKNLWFKVTHWETWHYLAKYIPISPAWFWYCLRARSPWFFTPSNPSITFGGFEGEGKMEMYKQLPPGTYPNSLYISQTLTFHEVEKLVNANNFSFPFVVKPDAGMMGFLFRTIHSVNELRLYHSTIPFDYIIQEYVDYPLEVSVFYYRFPNELKGTITGFIKKEFLQVTGDGESTLLELMHQYPRVRFRLDEMKTKHTHKLNDIIPAGEIYFLSYALNLSRGGKLVSLEHEKDDRLLKVFDDISLYTGNFYYGRYDIKCASIEDLKNGRNFSILEYNGCGAEPHHVYGNGNTLLQAYGILLKHWKVLFKISRYNHHNGIRQWDFIKGWRYMKEAKKHFRELKKLDGEILTGNRQAADVSSESQTIIEKYHSFLANKAFPCVGAKAALGLDQIKCLVVDHMACPKDDRDILQFLYTFVDDYRNAATSYHSAAIIFKQPDIHTEQQFDALLWQRLQALHDLDATNYSYDHRVDANPASPHFSFSLKQEAFFILGLHPGANRAARQFKYPTLVFNPHAEFQKLRQADKYEPMKEVVRKRDIKYSGSINPMLKDFGELSEVYQYSGINYDNNWQCPLTINHDNEETKTTIKHHPPA